MNEELRKHLAVFDIGPAEIELLRETGKILLPFLDEVVSGFYDTVRATPDMPTLLGPRPLSQPFYIAHATPSKHCSPSRKM